MITDDQAYKHSPVWCESRLLHTSHGMFTRNHGISPAPFNSLNLGMGTGDSAENVLFNRQCIKHSFNLDILVTAKQVHEAEICCVGAIEKDTEVEGYDAIVTDRPGIGLLIQQADCQAILIHEPLKKVIGAIHCGWRGSVLNIIGSTVERMSIEYGCNPAAMQAVISPSLGPCCAEFKNYRTEIPEHLHTYQVRPDYFNFWQISRDQLLGAGLSKKSVDIISICTSCNKDFFSYRRSKKKGRETTGRHGSLICLPG